MPQRCNVVRIHLKTGDKNDPVDRKKLISFCLHNKTCQYVAIGWSCAYVGSPSPINDFKDYYEAVKVWCKNNGKRLNPVINKFHDTKVNDLFWTRDIDGMYWICRAKGAAEAYRDDELDIGARVPVEAYKYGTEVPGQIKATFTRSNGGTAETLTDDLGPIIAFSQYAFNNLVGKKVYDVAKIKGGNVLDNLPDFDLEELVISYIQIKYDYYVLSNSIAKKSTTAKIECEFRSRDKNNPRRAVVQVKGGDDTFDASGLKGYDDEGYIVYIYAHGHADKVDKLANCVEIKPDDLLNFYQEYKSVLPDSITKWESLFE